MNQHEHKATKTRTIPFAGTVPYPIEENPRAYGWTTEIETCACGAERHSAVNGQHQELGRWCVSLAPRYTYWIGGDKTRTNSLRASIVEVDHATRCGITGCGVYDGNRALWIYGAGKPDSLPVDTQDAIDREIRHALGNDR